MNGAECDVTISTSARDNGSGVFKTDDRRSGAGQVDASAFGSSAVMISALMLSAASPSAPDAAVIEWFLLRKEYCTATVDGCVDHDGRQLRPSTRFAVSDVVCEEMKAYQWSWRCSFDVRQTRWMEGDQVGEAEHKQMTRIFDAVSVIDQNRKKQAPQVIWMERASE